MKCFGWVKTHSCSHIIIVRQTEISIGIFSTRETNITLEIEITEKNFEIGIHCSFYVLYNVNYTKIYPLSVMDGKKEKEK